MKGSEILIGLFVLVAAMIVIIATPKTHNPKPSKENPGSILQIEEYKDWRCEDLTYMGRKIGYILTSPDEKYHVSFQDGDKNDVVEKFQKGIGSSYVEYKRWEIGKYQIKIFEDYPINEIEWDKKAVLKRATEDYLKIKSEINSK